MVVISPHYVHACAHRGQKMAASHLELELQVVVSCHVESNPDPLEEQPVQKSINNESVIEKQILKGRER